MDASTVIGAWVAVGLTLGLYSFLYKDNPLFKLCEHIYLGAAMGWLLVSNYFETVKPNLLLPLYHSVQVQILRKKGIVLGEEETLWLIVPFFLSLFLLLRFIPRLAWVSRWSFAFIVGCFSGLAIPAEVSADIFKQVEATHKLWAATGSTWYWVNTSLILIGVLTVLFYFFFSIEHKGPAQVVARTGIFFIMISFGAAFGYTVMARESLLIGRMQELIKCSGKEYNYATLILLPYLVLHVALFDRAARRTQSGTPAEPEA